MVRINRRQFLSQSKKTSVGLAAAAVFTSPTSAKPISPNEKLVLGMIGIRGRGALHSTGFAKRNDCEIAYLADPDSRLFGTPASKGYKRFTDPAVASLPRLEAVTKLQGKRPKTVKDLRRVLDDKSVYCVGGRWSETGAFPTPDTQVVTYEFDDMVMLFEMTLYTRYMILADQKLRDGDIFPHWPQNSSRIEIFGSKGLMVLGRHGMGWQDFGRPVSRKPVVVAQEYGRWTDDDEHKDDFFDAIRNNRKPNADIEEAHLSTLYSQYGNISYRLGSQKLVVDPQTETFTNSDAGNALLKREYRSPYIIPSRV